MCMDVLFECMFAICVSDACGSKKKSSDPPELGLQTFVSLHMESENWIWVLKQSVPLTTEPSTLIQILTSMSSKTWYIVPQQILLGALECCVSHGPITLEYIFPRKFFFWFFLLMGVYGFVLGALMITLGIFSMLHKCATTELPPA